MVDPVLIALHRDGAVAWHHEQFGLISIACIYDQIVRARTRQQYPAQCFEVYHRLSGQDIRQADAMIVLELSARLKAIMMTYGEDFRGSACFADFQHARYAFERAARFYTFSNLRREIVAILGEHGD